MAFVYNQLVPVVFGDGAINELGAKVKEAGCKKVMCVYDGGVKAAGIAPKAEASLKAAGVEFVVFDKLTAEPTEVLVNECGAMAKSAGVDGFVGVGGGSSMDCAKAAALLMNHDAPIEQYFTAPPSFLECSVPVILVPTTAGTGSENTMVCVISDTKQNLKLSVFMRSTMAIIDPELTLTVPASITANTGLDAFTHASEAITALKWNPRSELMASAALTKISKYLPIAYQDGSNKQARYELCLASNWAGISFADTDVHLGHAMADGISSMFHTPHGMNCIWTSPELMKFCAPTVPEKVKIVGESIGVEFNGNETPTQIGEKTAAAIRALMKSVGIKSPKEMGFSKEQFMDCAEVGFNSGLRFNCPTEPTPENVRELYGKIYDNYQ